MCTSGFPPLLACLAQATSNDMALELVHMESNPQMLTNAQGMKAQYLLACTLSE